ncbi:hypothetical protein [Nocardioides sp.]|uniref:hypothetical protein n=1 Tax=Nocardioides sp. TaxID=35761 RepID=UPI001A1E689E|nr:hypothetical protein [Nocardioides sp.]MBJ7359525.1 hypothetical protein [Nocardioides sp.]
MTTTVTHHTDDTMLDEAWLAAPRHRSRLRLVLATLLAASLCFLGGTLVQKHFGAETSATPAGPAGLPTGAEGFPEGFPAAGGQVPGAVTGGSGDDGTGDTENEGTDDTGAVVGTVVSIDGDVWTVEDLGGERHEVRVTADSDLVRETSLTPDQVAVGDLVDISGTTAGGRLTAADVALR